MWKKPIKVFVCLAVAFLCFCQVGVDPYYGGSRPDSVPPPTIEPWRPQFTEMLAHSIAIRLSEKVVDYRKLHGRLSSVEGFRGEIETTPVHNPLKGAAEIHGSDEAQTSAPAGWTYGLQSGQIRPVLVMQRNNLPDFAGWVPSLQISTDAAGHVPSLRI